jgi:hypothetical protein
LFIAKFQEVSFLDVILTILTSPSLMIEMMGATFSPIDLLFYALAVYQGYRLSFRRITQAEIDKAVGSGQPVAF